MAASAKQIRANRQNAAKSTGPKSPIGKRRSSTNALKHGILSKDLVLATEENADFQQLLKGLVDAHQPDGATEIILVEKMAIALWKMKRLIRVETARINVSITQAIRSPLNRVREISSDDLNQHAMAINAEQLMKYQSLLEGQYYRALNTLLTLQEMNKTVVNVDEE